jgi:hypothetical protein
MYFVSAHFYYVRDMIKVSRKYIVPRKDILCSLVLDEFEMSARRDKQSMG